MPSKPIRPTSVFFVVQVAMTETSFRHGGRMDPGDALARRYRQTGSRPRATPPRAGRSIRVSSSKSPPDANAQPDIEAESRHRPESVKGTGAHVFHLNASKPTVFDGGTLQGATEENWPVLKNQQGSVYLARLEPGGVREPHWHPSAWEMNYVISGKVRWSFVGPNATHDSFDGETGDLVFAPQGHFHYFENASATEDLVVLIVFNASAGEPDDDVGIVASLSAIPTDVLAAVFKAPAEAFANLPRKLNRVTIARKTSPSS
jgi:oxalate decarboxylase